MKKFSREEAGMIAVIDKRQALNFIFPMAFIQQVGDKGYQEFAFYQNKYLPGLPRKRRPNSVMNLLEDGLIQANFLLVGPAFGLDDKKEQALAVIVALRALDIRAMIGVEFGLNFKQTALKQGILIIELALEEWQELADWQQDQEKLNPPIMIDLLEEALHYDQHSLAFTLPPLIQQQFIQGEDQIAYSMKYLDLIQAYEAKSPY